MATLVVDIPGFEESFFRRLMKKMGWEVRSRESVLKEYIESRPADCPLTDEDILAEVKAVRHGK